MEIPIGKVLESYINRGEYRKASDFLRKNRKKCSHEEYQEYLAQIPEMYRKRNNRYKPQPGDDDIVFYRDNIGLGPQFRGEINRKRFETKQFLEKVRQSKKEDMLKKQRNKAKVNALRMIEMFLMNAENDKAKKVYHKYQKDVFGLVKDYQLPDFNHLKKTASEKLETIQRKGGMLYDEAIEHEKYCTATLQEWLKLDDYISEKKLERLVGEHKIWREHYVTRAQAEEYQKYYNEVKTLLEVDIPEHNNKILDETERLIGLVDGKRLDRQQLSCICKKSRNHLVNAGAGTGKTFTIVGKAAYLVKSGICNPEEILAISFTNRARDELRNRLNKVVPGVNVFTFHGLGKGILRQAGIIVDKVISDNRKLVREGIMTQDDEYHSRLLKFIEDYKIQPKSDLEFESQEEYDQYLKSNPPTTLSGEKVKSYGELAIANFLTRNQIQYEYESTYREANTADNEHQQYRPDFYLPDYGIYIEYFAIDRDGNPPKYFRDGYTEGMELKRKWHQQNNTVMLELYAYEHLEHTMLASLEKQLSKHNVPERPLSDNDLWSKLSQEHYSILNPIINQFSTIINHVKAGKHNFQDLMNENRRTYGGDEFKCMHNEKLLELIKPIYEYYQHALTEQNAIDFNDMIYQAIEVVREHKFSNPYKCIIIDEYQDTSKSRSELIRAMRASGDCELFCVGDDWQSIYRHAGTNLDEFLNFESYWGESEESKIETTYRYPQRLADISGDFIMKNSAQKQKKIVSKSVNADNVDVIDFLPAYNDNGAVHLITERLKWLPANSTVGFLGRYNDDDYMLVRNENLELYPQYDNHTGRQKFYFKHNPTLKIEFTTIHKSKGLEYDYVFIMNNKDETQGFPCQIQDDPIMSLFIRSDNNFEEERRLMYVALTRARQKVFLVSPSPPDDYPGKKTEKSCFIRELTNTTNQHPEEEDFVFY